MSTFLPEGNRQPAMARTGRRGGPDRHSHDGHDHRVSGLSGEIEHLRSDLASAGRRIADLEAALQSNRRIGIAVGILMGSRNSTAEEAFDSLRRASNVRNEKLRRIAEQVIDTGTLG